MNKPIMKTVTFTESVCVKDHNGEIEFEAKAGATKELAAPSAARWIRRGKAVEGETTVKPVKDAVPSTEANKNAKPITAADDAKKESEPKPAKKSAAKKKAATKKQAN